MELAPVVAGGTRDGVKFFASLSLAGDDLPVLPLQDVEWREVKLLLLDDDHGRPVDRRLCRRGVVRNNRRMPVARVEHQERYQRPNSQENLHASSRTSRLGRVRVIAIDYRKILFWSMLHVYSP